MPVQIDIFDFKCFNQLRNGEAFNLNLSEFAPNLVGNVGEKIKVEYTANIQQNSVAGTSDEWFISNGVPFKQIERSSGSFLDDGVQVGDEYLFYPDYENRRGTGFEYSATVDFISSDGKELRYTVTGGADTTAGNTVAAGIVFSLSAGGTPDNYNTALFLKFGLIGNEETFNFISKTTEAQQVYYVGELVRADPAKDAESLGSIKDWVTGMVTVEFTGNQPDFAGAQYIITHEFILNPFYILSYRQFIDSGTIPGILAGDSSLKYAAELEFRKTLTNTGSSKIQSFDGLPGFVGWYGENFNGLNKKYQVASVSYEDDATGDPYDALNINAATKITIVVDNPDAAITDYSCAVYLIRVPTSEDEYIGTETDLIENFLLKSEVVSSPATNAPNVDTALSGGNLIIEYSVAFSTAEKLRLTTEDEFLLFVQIEDPTISAGNSDRVALIADLRNYVDINFINGFVSVSKYTYLQHGQALGEDGDANPITSNEDGVILDATFGLDTTKDVVLNNASIKLIAYNPNTGASFELDNYDFNLGALVINAGVQEIEVETTRGYTLPVDDEFNLVRITTEAQNGDFREYALVFGQKIKWQDWLLNVGVDNVFFDAAEPNNNLNFKSSNYSGEQDYVIRLALVLNVSGTDDLGRTLTGDFINLGGVLSVGDYNESTDAVSGIIQTFDIESGNSLDGNILFNGKDTLFRAVFQNAGAMQYGIHRIEPSQSPGDGIFELSSVMPSVNNNLLKPVDGETLLKFDVVGSELTTECLIDGSLLQENTQYKLSARVGTIPIPLGDPFTFTVDTEETGGALPSANNQICLPLLSSGTYNFVVDWGDGIQENITAWNQAETTHTYLTEGIYQINVYGIIRGWSFTNTGNPFNDSEKLTNIAQWSTFQPTGIEVFQNCINLDITATDTIDLSLLSSLEDFFDNCQSLEFNNSIDSWDTSTIVNMGSTFRNCFVFNQSLNSWDTSNVTSFRDMFNNAGAFDQYIGDWDVSNSESFERMFRGCAAYNQPLTNWVLNSNPAVDINMNGMFQIASTFNQNVNNLNTGRVSNMNSVFSSASIFNQPLNNWDVSNVEIFASTFAASAFNQDIGMWNTGSATNMFRMFATTPFNQDISGWDVTNVTTFQRMFQQCSDFNQNINGWITTSLQSLSQTFSEASSFNQPLDNWDVSNVITTFSTFQNATSFNQPLNSWDVSSVANMSQMFFNASSFNQDLHNWVTSSATNMGRMFQGCTLFNGNISTWDVSNNTTFVAFLQSALNFSQDLSGWNPSSCNNLGSMLQNTQIDSDLGGWDIQNVTNANNMLTGVTLSIGNYDSLLAGWNANIHNNGVTFDGGNSICTGGIANADRVALVGDGWTITDGN